MPADPPPDAPATATDDLARTLWHGPLPDPGLPARALAARIAAGDYGASLRLARTLAGYALSCDIDAALDRWHGSIDLALVAVQMRGAVALDLLEARVRRQNRRHGVLARAAWAQGQAARARAALARIDPRSDTAAADRQVRVELGILDGDWPLVVAELPALDIAPAQRARLTLQAEAARHGPAALKSTLARMDATGDATGDAACADPGLWRYLLDHFLSERDFAAARAAMARFCALTPDPAEARAAQVVLALDCGDWQEAGRLLAPVCAAPPWTWRARDHVQYLRMAMMRADAQTADHDAVCSHAEAALRLHPGHGVLQGLWLSAIEGTGDWTALEARLRAMLDTPATTWPQVWTPARGLARLGRPDLARDRLAALDLNAADATTRARHALALAEMQRDCGDLAGAAATLAPVTATGGAQRSDPTERIAAGTRADLALARAELALWRCDAATARGELAPALASCPDRMAVWMLAARVAFLAGDASGASDALARFAALRAAQAPLPPRPDLRDRIVADALQHDKGPGAAALALFRAGATVPARARPAPRATAASPIPLHLHHYWEGPRNGAVSRALDAWARLHPACAQTVHDPAAARALLAEVAPDLGQVFDRQTLPAGRADIFRAALIAHRGGIYADVDEYPRAAITDWLTGTDCVLVRESGHATLANNFIAARPGLALFAALTARLLAGPGADPYPWWDSGPAALTLCLVRDLDGARGLPGLRLLAQAEYCARVATNLPYPHKRGALHWR